MDITLLPENELFTALASADRAHLFVGVKFDKENDTLILCKGDLVSITVPLVAFRTVRGGPVPEPAKVSLANYGQTICLGDYRISSEYVIHETASKAPASPTFPLYIKPACGNVPA